MEEHEAEIEKLKNIAEFLKNDRKRDNGSFENRIETIENKLEFERNEEKKLVNNFEEKIRSKNEELAEIKADLQRFKNILENETEKKNIKNNFEEEILGKEIAEIRIELQRFKNLVEEEVSGALPLGYLPNYIQGPVRDIPRFSPRYSRVLSALDIPGSCPRWIF